MSEELTEQKIRELRAGITYLLPLATRDNGESYAPSVIAVGIGDVDLLPNVPEYVAAFFVKTPEAIDFLLARLDEAGAANQRLTDLVRYSRHNLHNTDLITDDEYAALVTDSESGQRVARLEGYDKMRDALKESDRKAHQLCYLAGSMMLACKQLAALQEKHRAKPDIFNCHSRTSLCEACRITVPDFSDEAINKLAEESDAAFTKLDEMREAMRGLWCAGCETHIGRPPRRPSPRGCSHCKKARAALAQHTEEKKQ